MPVGDETPSVNARDYGSFPHDGILIDDSDASPADEYDVSQICASSGPASLSSVRIPT
jgi:hypothetical protein